MLIIFSQMDAWKNKKKNSLKLNLKTLWLRYVMICGNHVISRTKWRDVILLVFMCLNIMLYKTVFTMYHNMNCNIPNKHCSHCVIRTYALFVSALGQYGLWQNLADSEIWCITAVLLVGVQSSIFSSFVYENSRLSVLLWHCTICIYIVIYYTFIFIPPGK